MNYYEATCPSEGPGHDMRYCRGCRDWFCPACMNCPCMQAGHPPKIAKRNSDKDGKEPA